MKTKRFLSAVAYATMAFTLFACSDDKEDTLPGYGACYANFSSVEMCMTYEKEQDPTQKERHPMNEEFCAIFDTDFELPNGTTKYRSACPTGYKLKCDDEQTPFKEDIVVYIYGKAITSGMTCEEFFHLEEEED